jgi:hypothetical protein
VAFNDGGDVYCGYLSVACDLLAFSNLGMIEVMLVLFCVLRRTSLSLLVSPFEATRFGVLWMWLPGRNSCFSTI